MQKKENNQKLLTYNDVAKMAGVTPQKVRSDRALKRINNLQNLEPKILFTEEESKEYAEWVAKKGNLAMDFNLTVPYRILPTGRRVHKFFGNPEKYRNGINLAINKNGDFINLNRMKKIKPYQTGNGHLQINLWNGCQPLAHDLVNLLWNDNAKCKPNTHHINGIKTDNRAVNLISMFDNEHQHAHKLIKAIKAATSRKEKAVAKKEYRDFIKSIRADNKEMVKEDLRIIDDLDFPSDSRHQNYMLVTEQSWRKYLHTGNESDLVIRGEYFN